MAFGGGLAGVAAGWSLWVVSVETRGNLLVHPLWWWSDGERTEWERAWAEVNAIRAGSLVAGGIGAAAIGSALPFLAPREEGAPWWSWVVGVAGVGLAFYGSYLVGIDGSCAIVDPALGCRLTYTSGPQGALVLLTSSVLIELPLVMLLESERQVRSVSVSAHASGFDVLILGTW